MSLGEISNSSLKALLNQLGSLKPVAYEISEMLKVVLRSCFAFNSRIFRLEMALEDFLKEKGSLLKKVELFYIILANTFYLQHICYRAI
jgi:hypothetical protein